MISDNILDKQYQYNEHCLIRIIVLLCMSCCILYYHSSINNCVNYYLLFEPMECDLSSFIDSEEEKQLKCHAIDMIAM